MKRPLLRHALADAYERERQGREMPTCDACGAHAPLTREEVEGVVCERCPRCREEGAVP